MVENHTDGAYAALFFQIDCPVAPLEDLRIDYSLFFDFDTQHRGLLSLDLNGQNFNGIFTTDERSQRFSSEVGQENFGIFFFVFCDGTIIIK